MIATFRVGTVECGDGLGPDPSILGLDLLAWTEADGVIFECNGQPVQDRATALTAAHEAIKAAAAVMGVTPGHAAQALVYAIKAGWLS